MKFRARLLHVWLLLAVFTAFPVWAQTSTPTATPTDTPTATSTPSPTPVPVPVTGIGDISGSVQAAQSEIRDIETQLQNDQLISTIQSSLPLLTREITARLADNNRTLQARPSLDTLRQLERDWGGLGQELPGWQTELKARGSALDTQLSNLDQEEATWKMTLTSVNATLAGGNTTVAPKTPVDTSVISVIQALIASIEQTSAALTQRQGQVFILETAVALQASRVNEALAAVVKARDRTVVEVFVQDSLPLWSAGIRKHIGQGLFKEIASSGSSQLSALFSYLQLQFGRLILQAVVFLFLYGLMRWLYSRIVHIVAGDPSLIRATRVLAMPVTTALLLSLVCVHWSDPTAPRLLTALVAAVALIPSVFLLRNLLESHYFPILNAVVVFFVLNQLRFVAQSLPLVARLLLLLESTGAALFVLWFDQRYVNTFLNATSAEISDEPAAPQTEQEGARKRSNHWFYLAVRLFFGIFLLDTVANIIGYVNFATLFGNGIFISLDLGVIFYGLLNISQGKLSVPVLPGRVLES